MLGIKSKITIAILLVMFLALAEVTVVSYENSKKQLTKAVDTGNLDLVHAVASEINTINEREFKMIESIAKLSNIRDPEVDMHDKWEFVNFTVKGNSHYTGLGFFDEKGVGYATSGKYSDLHDREYLEVSMQGRRALQDPDFSPVTGKFCSYYAVPVYDFNNRQIAEISCVVDATELCKTVSEIGVGKNSHPFIVSMKTGKYIAHQNEDLPKDGVLATDNVSKGLKSALAKALSGATATEVFYDEMQKQKMTIAYQPVPNTEWAVVCMAPYSDFYGEIKKLLFALIASSAVSLVIASIIAYIAISYSIKPIKNVASAVEEVASGDADLTHRLTSNSNDEIGSLTKDYNKFLEKMQTIINELKRSKEDLRTYGESLSGMVRQNANFLSGTLSGIRDVENEVETQHIKVNNTVGTVDKISKTVESLRTLLAQQDESIQSASSAVTEMIGNIESVTSSIKKMAVEFDTLKDNVENGIKQQTEVNERIKQIEAKSKMLSEANTVISSIASQTNLLAMNAAIEAAHAGEAGKGFAVVADEIRKLSENSSTQSKNIGMQLKEILNGISGVVHSSNQATDAFGIVMSKTDSTSNLVHEIELAMAEQSEGSKQIGDSLSYLNDATLQVRTGSNDVDNARQEIIGEVQELETSSASVSDYIQKMEEHVKHIETSNGSLMDIATSISSSIHTIGTQIDKFKS